MLVLLAPDYAGHDARFVRGCRSGLHIPDLLPKLIAALTIVAEYIYRTLLSLSGPNLPHIEFNHHIETLADV
jgi:hypothetical protein